jgi:hypothetical protein
MKPGDLLRPLRSGWCRFWFAPASPENLGICRLLFFGGLLLYFLRSDFSVYAGDVAPVFWRPTWSGRRLFPSGPPAEHTVVLLQAAWKVSLAMASAGLLSRAAAGAACVLSAALLGLPYNFGIVSHMTAATVFVCGIMALSRCGDAWSLDRLLARRLRKGAPAPPVPGGEYTWPVRLVWVLLSLVFFGAGVSKLRHSGLAWVTSDTLEQLLRLAHHPVGPATAPLTRWGLRLAAHPLPCKLMAAATIVFEVGYPLALLGGRLRVLLVSAMALMMVGVRLLMGPPFELLIFCHLFWVPWHRLAAVARRSFVSPAARSTMRGTQGGAV